MAQTNSQFCLQMPKHIKISTSAEKVVPYSKSASLHLNSSAFVRGSLSQAKALPCGTVPKTLSPWGYLKESATETICSFSAKATMNTLYC